MSVAPPPARARTRHRLLWSAVVALGLLFLVRLVWLREYSVRSGSMEPTIHGSEDDGESVLVAFGRGARPERFDLVVARVPGHDDPLVKRVVALGGESVEIRNGDLWIDGKVLPPDAPRPEPVLMFDDRTLDLAEWFDMGSSERNPWERGDGEWLLDATGVARGSNGGMMYLAQELRDGYLGPDGVPVAGDTVVHDAIVALEVLAEDPPATVRLGLHEMGDTFEVVLEPTAEGAAEARLLRRRADPPLEELAAAAVAFERGRWHSLCFSNLDDALRFVLDGEEVLAATYERNAPHPNETLRGTVLGRSYGHRVSLGGEEGRARFRHVRVWRDLHYTDQGKYAVDEPLQLAPDEVFLLGDHSSHSADGRNWGPTPLDELIGRPVWVVWPPGRIRPLNGARLGAICPTVSDPTRTGSD